MSAIIIPELIIHRTLTKLLEFITKDCEDATDEKDTLLYKLLGEDEDKNILKMNRVIFYDQAKHIFTKKDKIKVNYGYNMESSDDLALHIILPSENGRDAAIGGDEGYDPDNFEPTIEVPERPYEIKYTQLFDANYQIMITSSNQTEIMIVYHILKACLLISMNYLELNGLRTSKVSGGDLLIQQEYVPNHIFSKVINLSFVYELTVPAMIKNEDWENLIFSGTPTV